MALSFFRNVQKKPALLYLTRVDSPVSMAGAEHVFGDELWVVCVVGVSLGTDVPVVVRDLHMVKDLRLVLPSLLHQAPAADGEHCHVGDKDGLWVVRGKAGGPGKAFVAGQVKWLLKGDDSKVVVHGLAVVGRVIRDARNLQSS